MARPTTNKQWVLAKRPHGMISEANWRMQEAPVPQLADGEALVQTLYLSCDPTQRGWMEDRPSYRIEGLRDGKAVKFQVEVAEEERGGKPESESLQSFLES